MTTNTNTAPHVDALMEQAQVFASSWALVGSRFDDGSELANAEEQKRELRTMIEEALAYAVQPYDHSPQAQTLEEAAQDVGKWLNERPNRPLDLRSVAMLVAGLQQPREPLSDETLKQMHHEDQFGLFCDYDEFEQIARAIEVAHGIKPAHKEQT